MRTKSSGWIITCNSNNNWTEAKPCAEGFSLKVQSPTMQWKEITRLCQCEKCCPSATFFSTCPITNHTNKTIWYRLLLILRHPDNIMDIPWSKHGWLYPGLPRSYSPQIITNVRRVWGSARRPSPTLSWNLRVSDAANFLPHSHFYWEKMSLWTGRTGWWMTSIWPSSSSPAAPFPKVFSDQNWCVLGNGNSRRGSHHPAVNTSPHIWTSGEHERPRGWYLKIQVWTKISIKHKPLKLSVYMWICMISCFNFTFVIRPTKYQPNFSSSLTQSTDPLLGPTCQVHKV